MSTRHVCVILWMIPVLEKYVYQRLYANMGSVLFCNLVMWLRLKIETQNQRIYSQLEAQKYWISSWVEFRARSNFNNSEHRAGWNSNTPLLMECVAMSVLLYFNKARCSKPLTIDLGGISSHTEIKNKEYRTGWISR